MPRFDKLEFDDGEEQAQTPDQPAGTRREATDWMKQAHAQRCRGLYENALKLYSRALETDKACVAGWVGQVQMLVLLCEYPEAELWARKALELFPSHGDLLAARGQAFCRLRDLKRAHEMSDASLKQCGQSAYPWVVRGELMLAARQAIDQHCFDKALQMSSDWLVAAEIALVYLFYRNPGRALLRAKAACETAPDQAFAWLIQARCQHALGQDQQANRSLQTCLQLHPGHEEAKELLLTVERSRLSSAVRWLRGLFRS